MVAHPDDPASGAVIAALGIGVALFVGFSAVSYWYLHRRILVVRAVAPGAMLIGIVLVAPLAPIWALGVVAVALMLLVGLESRSDGARANARSRLSRG